ncbi:hypothetical protein Chor_010638 [Crotalus horridus]
MKTLLLTLMVVAFMYLDSGYTLRCRSCIGLRCDVFKNCAKGQNVCYVRVDYSDIPNLRITRGCAAMCRTTWDADEYIFCCITDNCN